MRCHSPIWIPLYPCGSKELLGDASEFSQQDIKLRPLAIPAASDAAPQVTDDTSALAGVVIDPQAPTDAARERLLSATCACSM